MLVNSKELFKLALKNNYAIGAYNINNLEWTKYILEACQEDKSPVILSASESSIKYMGGYSTVSSLVKNLIKELNITIPVVLHLDHGKSFESCQSAIDNGFTSVMIDASSLNLDDNIKLTLEVINYANSKNVSVEAEVGVIAEKNVPADPEDAKEFVMETGVHSLAPSIGNKHGVYKTLDEIDFELLGEISKVCKVPLVMHGASGLDDNKIKTAIFCGVTKFNINTDIMIAWSNMIRKYLHENKEEIDPRKIISSGRDAIKKTVHEKNMLFNSVNKG